MMRMRHSTWRRAVHLGVGLIVLCFAGGIYFREERGVAGFEILGLTVIVVSTAFHIVVALLQKAGLLEFSYTEADRVSYLYNMKKLHRQMTDNRRARKRE